jgi:hypothetical protein
MHSNQSYLNLAVSCIMLCTCLDNYADDVLVKACTCLLRHTTMDCAELVLCMLLLYTLYYVCRVCGHCSVITTYCYAPGVIEDPGASCV